MHLRHCNSECLAYKINIKEYITRWGSDITYLPHTDVYNSREDKSSTYVHGYYSCTLRIPFIK